MNERDRPWHFDAVVQLCCRLPRPARTAYRALQPPTMQRLLARRARAERALADAMDAARTMQRQLDRLEHQVDAKVWARKCGRAAVVQCGTVACGQGGLCSSGA
eukprot:363870-Chlamydomonas_euryale.AAC.2